MRIGAIGNAEEMSGLFKRKIIMNTKKLEESISMFYQFIVENEDFYLVDERGWKKRLSERFSEIFYLQNVESDEFFNSLFELFTDPKVYKDVIWLAGGSFYDYQRFIDLLETNPDISILQDAFKILLYSNRRIKFRVNSFRDTFNDLFIEKGFDYTIQLNLISQFLGLTQPKNHYIYKATEFRSAVNYFEYRPRLTDRSAGGKYEYYLNFAKKILEAMKNIGIVDVDFIDVQTFIYRDDWYTQQRESVILAEYELDVQEGMKKSVDALIKGIQKSKPQPAKITRSIYYFRDPNLAALVRKLAEGKCDLCGKPAPFKDPAGHPFLECRHITPCADGGPDALDNVVALCPNCYMKVSVINLEEDNQYLRSIAKSRSNSLL